MLLFALPALADAPPTVLVAFSPDGAHVAVETRWIDGGPGFANARLQLYATEDGAPVGDWRARLTEGRAMEGEEGASKEVRAMAATALADARIDFAQLVPGTPCDGNACGPLAVTVTSRTTTDKQEQCHGRAGPDLLTVVIGERTWVDEEVPAEGCPSAWTAASVHAQGDAFLLLLSFHEPGHEGYDIGFAPLPGKVR